MSEGALSDDVAELAEDLTAHGVPERRAKIVALASKTDLTYQEIATELDVESKGSVGNQIREYRRTIENGRWLVEHAPDV